MIRPADPWKASVVDDAARVLVMVIITKFVNRRLDLARNERSNDQLRLSNWTGAQLSFRFLRM